jgi:hypothetical protein
MTDALAHARIDPEAVAERSHAMVAERFTIQAMAATLAPLYQAVASQDADLARLAVLPS